MVVVKTIGVFSAILFVAMAGLWTLSYQAETTIGYLSGSLRILLTNEPGRLRITIPGSRAPTRDGDGSRWFHEHHWRSKMPAFQNPPYPWITLGFEWRKVAITTAVFVPHWFGTLLSTIYPLFLLVRRRQRAAARRCVACGYDLRGGGITCPECGTPVGKSDHGGSADSRA